MGFNALVHSCQTAWYPSYQFGDVTPYWAFADYLISLAKSPATRHAPLTRLYHLICTSQCTTDSAQLPLKRGLEQTHFLELQTLHDCFHNHDLLDPVGCDLIGEFGFYRWLAGCAGKIKDVKHIALVMVCLVFQHARVSVWMRPWVMHESILLILSSLNG